MKHSVIHIKEMDCSSEEQMLRMKLESLDFINQLTFDLPGRNLHIFHDGSTDTILSAIADLGFHTVLNEETDSHPRNFSSEPDSIESSRHIRERFALQFVLFINAAFFITEMIAGILAGSMGLLADSLDMLADALVYSISLYAVKSSLIVKKRTAALSGYLQLSLALLGFAEIIRRFVGLSDVPDYSLMISVSVLALAGNAASYYILHRARSGEVHIQSGMIFTSNDILANTGVIAAGFLTLFSDSMIPDLIVGSAVFALVLRGSLRILKLSES